MKTPILSLVSDRRALMKGAAALGALQVASPFIIPARRRHIRMGMVDPLTGVYAAPAGNEVMGAKLAVEQINAKGGILGRQVELLVEDSAQRRRHRRAEGAQADRARQGQFHDRQREFGIAAAMAQVTTEKKVLHIVSGGHTDCDHRQGLQVERVPRLQHDAHGSQLGI